MNSQQLAQALLSAAILGSLLAFATGRAPLRTRDQQGYRLFTHQRYQEAATAFSKADWRGVALFRAGKFTEAAALFAGNDTAAAAYNQGNSLVMLGKYTEAVACYDRALLLDPTLQPASANRALALARAEKLKREGGDMTGGKLGADEITLSEGTQTQNRAGEEESQVSALSAAEEQAIWLRNVQTQPADFLRAKFAYQYATGKPTTRSRPSANGQQP